MTTQNTSSAIVTLLMDELRQSLEPKVSHMLADYQLYKETHEAVLQIPFVKSLLERQRMCKCNAAPKEESQEQIQLEIIDVFTPDAPNLDSIAEYINSTVGTEEGLAEKKAPTDEPQSENEIEVEEDEEEDEEAASEEVDESNEEEEEVADAVALGLCNMTSS